MYLLRPAALPDGLDRRPRRSADGSIRGAVTIAHVVGEVLFLATPLLTVLWLVVCLPLLVAPILATAMRDERLICHSFALGCYTKLQGARPHSPLQHESANNDPVVPK